MQLCINGGFAMSSKRFSGGRAVVKRLFMEKFRSLK
jgi:hypothetical protein